MNFLKKGKNAKSAKYKGVSEELTDIDDSGEQEGKSFRRPFSLLGNFIFLCTLGIIGVIGWVVVQTWIPQDLSTLPGYKKAGDEANIPELLRQAVKKNVTLTLTEEDVNKYIASTLKASQHGILSSIARPNGVGVRFHEGYMEIIIERQIASQYLQTISLFVTVIQEEDPSSPLPSTRLEYRENNEKQSYIDKGGTLGSIAVPQGYMRLLLPAFENLADAYEDFLSSVIDNGRIIRISEGRIDLMPGRQTF